MRLKLGVTTALLAFVAVSLSACGNKGDLYLVPDEFTQQELEQLEQSLQEQGDGTDSSEVNTVITDTELEEAPDEDDDPKKEKRSN